MGNAPIFNPTGGIDAPVAWHYGDPLGEQRRLAAGVGSVDLSHRGVLRLAGADRLDFLNSLTTQKLLGLSSGESALTLNLNPQGFVLHELRVYALAEELLITSEPGTADELSAYFNQMRFRAKVAIDDASAEYAAVWSLTAHSAEVPVWRSPFAGGGVEQLVRRDALVEWMATEPAGTWAYEALRVAAGIPRCGFETDHHTLPHEVGWIASAVHLNKGCYRGQETVSKVERMGQPPRLLVTLLLDGSEDLPATGDDVFVGEKSVGRIGTAAQHYELGPIASALVKRASAEEATFLVGGKPAARL